MTVGNVRTNAINGAAKVSIRTTDNFWRFHAGLEQLKNLSECLVKNLLLELAEADIVGIFFGSYVKVSG